MTFTSRLQAMASVVCNPAHRELVRVQGAYAYARRMVQIPLQDLTSAQTQDLLDLYSTHLHAFTAVAADADQPVAVRQTAMQLGIGQSLEVIGDRVMDIFYEEEMLEQVPLPLSSLFKNVLHSQKGDLKLTEILKKKSATLELVLADLIEIAQNPGRDHLRISATALSTFFHVARSGRYLLDLDLDTEPHLPALQSLSKTSGHQAISSRAARMLIHPATAHAAKVMP